jgi:hypothetical protein
MFSLEPIMIDHNVSDMLVLKSVLFKHVIPYDRVARTYDHKIFW